MQILLSFVVGYGATESTRDEGERHSLCTTLEEVVKIFIQARTVVCINGR